MLRKLGAGQEAPNSGKSSSDFWDYDCNIVIEALALVVSDAQAAHSVDSDAILAPSAIAAFMHVVQPVPRGCGVICELSTARLPKNHVMNAFKRAVVHVYGGSERLPSLGNWLEMLPKRGDEPLQVARH